MKIVLVILIVLASCNSFEHRNNFQKERSSFVVHSLNSVKLSLEVWPLKRDSIIIKFLLTNTGNDNVKLYKPLLPDSNLTNDVFSIFETSTLKNVEFIGNYAQNDLLYNSKSPKIVKEKISENLFLTLEPKQVVELKTNIANKYLFEYFLDKKQNEFKISYGQFFPYIERSVQSIEVDSLDKKEKPVFFFLSLDKKEDPDSMRVLFKVPLH